MSDVFISYKHEDEARVAVLLRALRKAGLDVWWDREIPGGDQWRQRILTQLESAKCVIVVWSEASTAPSADFVIDEATRAKRRGTLLPVRMEDVGLPLGFGEQQALDLIAWDGDAGDPRFQDVVAAAKALIEGLPIPRPQGPRRRKAIAWGAGISVLAAAAAFIVILKDSSKIVCGIPGVRMVCGALGIGGAPSRAEESLWSSRRTGDCSALRLYLSKFPNGSHTSEAQARLAAATFETKETWTAEERRLPLVVRSAEHPSPSEQAARSAALARAAQEAQRTCVGFDQAEFRLQSARAIPVEWRCILRSMGYACGFDGEAVCKVEARHVDRVEKCP